MSLLSAIRLGKSYQSRCVVDGVSQAVHRGQVVGLLGGPFAGVAPTSAVDIHQIIGQLRARGMGMLIKDHNGREALGMCHHANIPNEDGVIAVGTPNAILVNQGGRRRLPGQ